MNINLLLNNNLFIIDFFNYQMLKKNLESLDTSNLPSDVDTIYLPDEVDKIENNKPIIIKTRNNSYPKNLYNKINEIFQNNNIYIFSLTVDENTLIKYEDIFNYINNDDIKLKILKNKYTELNINYNYINDHLNKFYEIYITHVEEKITELLSINNNIIIILDDDILIDKKLDLYEKLVNNININFANIKFLKDNYNLEY